jgi:hypothetical protein
MKPLRNQPALLVCLVVMALAGGCARKKPQPVTPTVAQSPAAAQPTPEATPEPQAQNSGAQPATQGTPPPDLEESQPAVKAEKSKPKNGKSHTAATETKKTVQAAGGSGRAAAETARNNPPRVVVKPDDAANGPIPGVISPSPAQPDVARDQATTEQLLQSADNNLSNIKRQLSQDEQAIVSQIRDYMTQSHQATKANDLVRAHNLALKAQLLSDDLARRR